ncbi:hypothetical protein FGG08_006375 [Glutinoglossum americanum]|uniref:Uncharacterized protein n=1 Tax=Glutinoglossum americanum TaxID=1670608 RepID=A0A9P8HWF2_9PEZI|nr:hypothetical protein FGG08_006375 [Glutinoglossum americanum]
MALKGRSSPLLRALKLQLVLSLFSRGGEPRKIAIRRNRWTALARCAIHILPVGPSIALIFLNTNNSYIGGELTGPSGTDSFKLGALQFAAKLHELSIQASIAAMLLSYIRYELTLGVGLPFGAIHAGLSFTDLSFLWSSELWGSMFSKESRFNWLRKLYLLLAVVGSVLLAALAAPSSAISVIPQLGLWPACGTSFWISASSEALWPSEVNSSHIGSPMCSTKTAPFNITCPSGGFFSIRGFGGFLVERGFGFVPGRTVPAFGTQATRNMNVTVKLGRNPDKITTATVPQAALADGMSMAGTWWPTAARFAQHRLGLHYIFQKEAFLSTETLQPITRAQCSPLNNRTNSTSNLLTFPRFDDVNPITTFFTDDQMWQDAFETNSTVRSNANLYWVKLDGATAPNSTMGAVVVLPIPKDENRLVYMTCNIDARWAESLIWRFYADNTMNVWGAPSNVPTFDIGRVNFNWTWRAISSTVEWAQSLNPVIDDQNTTTFSSIAATAAINSSSDVTHAPVIEAILAMMFADGLARIGSTASLQGQLKEGGDPNGSSDGKWVDEFMKFGDAYYLPEQAPSNWLKPRLRVSVYGWSYTSRDPTSRFALSILFTHILLAICHLMYSLIWGLSSSSWDSPAEITALALNSKPSAIMQNTCAGITRRETMGTHVRIVATKGEEGEKNHLEMQFRSPVRGKDQLLSADNGESVQINKKYGNLYHRRSNAATPSEA